MTVLGRLRQFARGGGETSFSQCGEDIIVDFLLRHILQIQKPAYLDIGTHDPVHFNNTYRFYRRGCKGVLVEPNPAYHARIRKLRKRDSLFPVGLGDKDEHATYFCFDADTLNTFSKEEARAYEAHGHKLLRETSVALKAVRDFVSDHCRPAPDFVSMDVEGKETEILGAWDFASIRPAAFCIETAEYTPDGSGKKRLGLVDVLRAHEYRVYADTYVNTIFADGRRWKGDGILSLK